MNIAFHNQQPRVQGPQLATTQAPIVDLRRQLALMRRRLVLSVAIIGVVFLVSCFLTMRQTPQFTATSKIMLDLRQHQVTDAKEVLSGLPPETGMVESEVEVLKSRVIAGRVVDALHLDLDPEFNWLLETRSSRHSLPAAIRDLISHGRKSAQANSAKISGRDAAVDSLLGRLKVSREGVTYVINIAFQADSPAKAALIANAFAENYLLEQLDAKFAANKRATDWLNSRLAGLKSQSDESQTAARQYEAAHDLVGVQIGQTPGAATLSSGSTAHEEEISSLTTQVATARAQLAEAEANLSTARQQLAKGSEGGDVAGALTSPVIQSLRKQRADTSAHIAELSGQYGAKNPEMINAKRTLVDVDTQIQGEIQRVISNLEAQVVAARQRAASLEGSLAKSKVTLNISNTAAGQLAQLQSRAQADSNVYQSFLDRFKQTTAQQGVEQSDARVVSYAEVPQRSSSPNIPLNLGLGLAMGIGMAGLTVFLLDALEAGLYTADDVERLLSVPHLSSIPTLETTWDYAKLKKVRNSPIDFGFYNPLSTYAESFRILRTAMFSDGAEKFSQIVTITSALPGEGKTVTSICLARTIALGGLTTVLVDCDLRIGEVRQKLNRGAKIGLLQVVQGTATLDDVIVRDELSGMFIIPMAPSEYTPKNVFGSKAMDEILAELRKRYQIIILDTAPVLPISDTRVLAPKSDVVVFLARWKKTPREAVKRGLHLLNAAGAPANGVALTLVDAKEQARSGYGDDGFYSRSYQSYFN